MPGAGISLEVDAAAALRGLDGLFARLDDPTPALDEIGSAMVQRTRRRFETELDPDGEPWKPSLRALEEGGQTLTDTGRLRASITHNADRSGVEWGTNVAYAATHQFGARIRRSGGLRTLAFGARDAAGRRRFARRAGARSLLDVHVGPYTIEVVARPFLGVSDADERAILRIVGDWLERA